MTSARRSWRRSFTALRAMPWRDRWLLGQAAIGLAAVEVLLACAGFRRCQAVVARLPRGPLRVGTDEEARTLAIRVARLVARAARRGPTGSACLAQALVLQGLLRRRGIDAELRIGIAKADARLDAHAWVEVRGHAVSGDGDVPERFQPLGAGAVSPGTGQP
jgi:hypothetical protein